MNNDSFELWFSLMALVIVLAIGYGICAVGCSFRWKDSGFESDYSAFSGCRIEVDGKWIPEDRYRAVE